MNLAVVILAAGKGKRMKSNLAKILHPLCGKPVVSYVFDSAKRLRPARIIVVVGHKGSEVVSHLDKDIELVEQKKQLGTGDATKTAEKLLRNFRDGLDAKDFDDAVSISKTTDGSFLLKVHIADVSHYVLPGLTLDLEARKRAFSVYLVDRVLPMLPPKLSEDLCSLNAGEDKLTLSVEMVVDKKGRVKDFEISKGIMRSNARLTYTKVDKEFKMSNFLSAEVKDCLFNLKELSEILEKKRIEKGSLNFETIEPKVLLDDEGRPKKILIRERTPATKLIEETMVLTNEVIANFVFWQEAPMVYRVHEEPDLEAVLEIRELVKSLGYPVKGLDSTHPMAFQGIISFAKGRPEKYLINSLLLRAMKQARYSATPAFHFGLASKHYTHFTSPIRRYPDLLVHRVVKRILRGEEFERDEFLQELAEASEYASIREREIDEAERESNEAKICELMVSYIGEVFDAIISGVTDFGLFVQLKNTAEGLVHVKSLKDDYYEFVPEHFLLKGKRTGKTYRLGDSIKVKLVDVSVGERRLDFTPVEDDSFKQLT